MKPKAELVSREQVKSGEFTSRRKPPPSVLYKEGNEKEATDSPVGNPSKVVKRKRSLSRNSRRKKKRTHVALSESVFDKIPKCFVVGKGLSVDMSADQLVNDLRNVMRPWCSTKLRRNRKQSVKDFIAVSGPLGVTHLQMVTQASKRIRTGSAALDTAGELLGQLDESANQLLKFGNKIYWKICGLPTGPTLTFEILEYSNCKDIIKSQKRPRNCTEDFNTSPLIVLNGFKAGSKHKEEVGRSGKNVGVVRNADESAVNIMRAMLTNMFPTLDVQTMKVGDCRRIVLFNHAVTPKDHRTLNMCSLSPNNAIQGEADMNGIDELARGHFVEFRHYAIMKRPSATSRTVRKLVSSGSSASASHSLDLGNTLDVADYIMHNKKRRPEQARAGYVTSESEFEDAAEVELPPSATGRKAKARQKSGSTADTDKKAGNPTAGAPDGIAEGKDSSQSSSKVGIGLMELGPRMFLRLAKVEEDVCSGEVLYHGYIKKTPTQLKELAAKVPQLKGKRAQFHKFLADSPFKNDDEKSTGE
eukprot:GHVS01040137.1.p1 GENE.GHVS01040137.1~~GHVS01040137.1.p1  ORF type:complete len:530 (+),score=44.57 GHVS01040137.1:123-1712(+)